MDVPEGGGGGGGGGGGSVGVQRSGCHTGLNVLPQSRLEVSRCRWMCRASISRVEEERSRVPGTMR